jgi:hypothetical protein
MALATTTLSAALTADAATMTVASATSLAAGRLARINGEIVKVAGSYTSGTTVQILRGQDGTKAQAHAVTSNVTHGDAADFANPAAGGPVTNLPAQRAREVLAYGAAGAITLPTPGNDMVALLNGTNALAMTLANPTKDMDGDILTVIGNGKAAHTVTYTAGLGNGGSGLDVGTFDTNAQCSMQFMAANGIWVPLPSPMSGTLTGCDVAVA